MNHKRIKNIEHSSILGLENLVSYSPGQIVSMTLAQNTALSMTLFAFDKDEEISTHESGGDALVMALDGEGEIMIEEQRFLLKKGDSIVMPAQKPHSVKATEQFKMFLVVVFPTP
jgi:quercetin dioxygenase-like cupin family protein